jgi:hypothetical protein
MFMKGQSELTATFVKLVQIGLVIVGALAIFFTFVEYEIFVHENSLERESYLLGNAVLSSNCFTNGVKGVLVQSKLENFVISCFKYPGKFTVTSTSYSKEIELIPKSSYSQSVVFNAVIELESGDIEPAQLEVFL